MIQKGEDTRTLGEYVRARRLAQGMTLQDASDRSGVDRSYWSRLETGEYQTPNPRFLIAMARALDIESEDLYALAGYAVPNKLPEFVPYLRAATPLPPEAIRDLEKYYAQLRAYYGIPEDQPVFPPRPVDKSDQTKPKHPPKATGRNRGDHPWRTS